MEIKVWTNPVSVYNVNRLENLDYIVREGFKDAKPDRSGKSFITLKGNKENSHPRVEIFHDKWEKNPWSIVIVLKAINGKVLGLQVGTEKELQYRAARALEEFVREEFDRQKCPGYKKSEHDSICANCNCNKSSHNW